MRRKCIEKGLTSTRHLYPKSLLMLQDFDGLESSLSDRKRGPGGITGPERRLLETDGLHPPEVPTELPGHPGTIHQPERISAGPLRSPFKINRPVCPACSPPSVRSGTFRAGSASLAGWSRAGSFLRPRIILGRVQGPSALIPALQRLRGGKCHQPLTFCCLKARFRSGYF